MRFPKRVLSYFTLCCLVEALIVTIMYGGPLLEELFWFIPSGLCALAFIWFIERGDRQRAAYRKRFKDAIESRNE